MFPFVRRSGTDGMEIVSRKDALARGDSLYFTGKPCKHGHKDQRYVSTHACVACSTEASARNYAKDIERNRAKGRARAAADKDKRRERFAAWYSRNREQKQAAARAWKAANPSRNKALWKAWRAANPDYAKRYASDNVVAYRTASRKCNAKRRHTVGEQIATMSKLELHEMSMLYEEAVLLGPDWHVDHITPLSKGGEHRPYNMQIVSAKYNYIKQARLLYIPADVGKHLPEHYKVAA